MGDGISLLPTSYNPPWQRSIGEAVARWWDIPTEALDTLWDPRTCPPAVLPYLANALGVPIWLDRWSIEQKRSFTAQWVRLSRELGQRRTFAAMLAAVDAQFVRWVVPPAICAPRPSRTDAERAAYRSQFPEVRVYAFAERAVRKGLLVCGQPWGGRHKAPQASTAPQRRAHRAEYIAPDGTRSDVTINVADPSAVYAGGYFELALPDKTAKLMPGRPWAGRHRFALASTAASRLYRYEPGDRRPDLLTPGLVPFALQPDKIKAPHAMPGRLSPGQPWFGRRRAPVPSVAELYVYDSVRLFDASIAATVSVAKPGGWICGRSQLGTDRFRIDVVADVSYRAPGRRFMPGAPLRGAPHAHDHSRMQEVCAALRAAKLGRDRVMLKTGLYREIEPVDNLLPSGALLPGQVIRTE